MNSLPPETVCSKYFGALEQPAAAASNLSSSKNGKSVRASGMRSRSSALVKPGEDLFIRNTVPSPKRTPIRAAGP